jgi:glycerol uptake facilitator-like aquaporin
LDISSLGKFKKNYPSFLRSAKTAFLLAAVVGSGIMAAKLACGNGALALLCNTLPTGASLTVLILIFGQLSGVSLAFALRGELPWPTFVGIDRGLQSCPDPAEAELHG